jgi:hypothetical protein
MYLYTCLLENEFYSCIRPLEIKNDKNKKFNIILAVSS